MRSLPQIPPEWRGLALRWMETEEDGKFVLDSWLRSMCLPFMRGELEGPYANHILTLCDRLRKSTAQRDINLLHKVYYEETRAILKVLLGRRDTRPILLVDREEPGFILGWGHGDYESTGHYVYVKRNYRGVGYGRILYAMVSQSTGSVEVQDQEPATFLTPAGMRLVRAARSHVADTEPAEPAGLL